MIRQAISCDICATEKKQTNHWFVAFEQSGELRLSGWNARNKLRPGMKHLCGQTCLHKLVDEFMARTLAVRPQHGSEEAVAEAHVHPSIADASVTSIAGLAAPHPAVYAEFESSARMIVPPAAARAGHAAPAQAHSPAPSPAAAHPQPLRTGLRPTAELVAMPGRLAPEETLPDEAPRYNSRNWRAEAWDRERERELRAVERRPDITPRRRSGS